MESQAPEEDVEVELIYGEHDEYEKYHGLYYHWKRQYLREKNKRGIVVVSFKIHRELLRRLEECAKRRGYGSRSEAIREAIIRFLLSEGCETWK